MFGLRRGARALAGMRLSHLTNGIMPSRAAFVGPMQQQRNFHVSHPLEQEPSENNVRFREVPVVDAAEKLRANLRLYRGICCMLDLLATLPKSVAGKLHADLSQFKLFLPGYMFVGKHHSPEFTPFNNTLMELEHLRYQNDLIARLLQYTPLHPNKKNELSKLLGEIDKIPQQLQARPGYVKSEAQKITEIFNQQLISLMFEISYTRYDAEFFFHASYLSRIDIRCMINIQDRLPALKNIEERLSRIVSIEARINPNYRDFFIGINYDAHLKPFTDQSTHPRRMRIQIEHLNGVMFDTLARYDVCYKEVTPSPVLFELMTEVRSIHAVLAATYSECKTI